MTDKIIFLDIDGVLNSVEYRKRIQCTGRVEMDPQLLSLLADLVNKTGAKLVISSTWRIGGIDKDSALQTCFKKYGLRSCTSHHLPVGGHVTISDRL